MINVFRSRILRQSVVLATEMWHEWLDAGNGQWTYISSVGPHQPMDQSVHNENTASHRIFIIIPGNPGMCRYYDEFAGYLQSNFINSSVWVISHLNHVRCPPELTKGTKNSDVVLLNDQIKHKVDFIKKFIPKSADVHLVGHSIGCYMIMKIHSELLQAEYSIKHCFFMMPTIERMAQTPDGRSLVSKSGLGLHYVPWVGAHILRHLPDNVKRYLLAAHLKRDNRQPAECVLTAAEELFHPKVVKNMIFMALDEMKNVKSLDLDLLKTLDGKLTIFYAQNDPWCPQELCDDMKTTTKDMNVKMVNCEPSVEHAFVINSSRHVADVLSEHLRKM